MTQNKTLFNIVSEVLSIEQHLLENGGEFNELTNNYFEINEANLTEKIDAYAYAIDRLDSTFEYLKKKEAEAKQAKKQIENRIEDLKLRLKLASKALNRPELRGLEYKYTVSKMKPKAVIIDKDSIPTTFVKEKIVFEIDNELLLKALNEGQEVQGAVLEEVVSLRRSIIKD